MSKIYRYSVFVNEERKEKFEEWLNHNSIDFLEEDCEEEND